MRRMRPGRSEAQDGLAPTEFRITSFEEAAVELPHILGSAGVMHRPKGGVKPPGPGMKEPAGEPDELVTAGSGAESGKTAAESNKISL